MIFCSCLRHLTKAGFLFLSLTSLFTSTLHAQESYDYIVVGAGAGGGPLASSLARDGFSVLLLEAGEDFPEDELYASIPALHPVASERDKMSWQFFVNHYSDPQRAREDSKYCSETTHCEGLPQPLPEHKTGVFYPRGSTVGGSTAVNAMISVKVHDSDWDYIAEITGDNSWRAESLQPYFLEIERNLYGRDSSTGHGTNGWLPVSQGGKGIPLNVTTSYTSLLKGLSRATTGSGLDLLAFLNSDINAAGQSSTGLYQVPGAIDENSRRSGVRQRIYDTISQGYPLTLRTRSLVSNVLFDDSGQVPKAIGVAYLEGAHLYRADRLVNENAHPVMREVFASKEVILSAGAFNTPQLLMLSGIGPKQHLESHNIPVRVDLPGVGQNLQDRYEVPVVVKKHGLFGNPINFPVLENCNFSVEAPDNCFDQWYSSGEGPYSQAGAIAGAVVKSTEFDMSMNKIPDSQPQSDPDLYVFGVGGTFKGYYPGYGTDAFEKYDQFSWIILKGHSNNKGYVKLRSSDPRDTPIINFQYFGDPASGEEPPSYEHNADLDAVVKGIKMARQATEDANGGLLFDFYTEVWPGPSVETDQQLRQFVMDESWGHHASCTAKIGPATDPMAVLDSRFRVYGTSRLRVVDASVFPRIPGFFPAVAINMLSEKAADIIAEDSAEL